MLGGLIALPAALDSRAHSQASAQSDPCVDAREQRCHPRLERLSTWLAAARQHEPGVRDRWVVEVGSWTSVDLDNLVADVRQFQQLRDRRRKGSGGDLRVAIHDRLFTIDEIEDMLGTNATLLRAATLHADVAILADQDTSRQESGESASVLVRDGTPQSVQPTSVHWRIARSLLDDIRPSPSEDASALLWYRAYSAHFLRERQLNMAQPHLDKAIEVFPSSWEVSLDEAYLHERFAAPSTQAARTAMTANGITSPVGVERVELELAATFFRRALAIEPTILDARVRLGYVLIRLGQPADAAAELGRALAGSPEGELLYLAELLSGRAEEALARRDAARDHYQKAAALYPRAQSPRLALSQLFRQSGDRQMALATLQTVTTLPVTPNGRIDPWWKYYDVHQDANDLLMALYARIRNGSPQ